MNAPAHNPSQSSIKPPVVEVGVIGWVRTNLFSGWFNSLLTLVTLYGLWKIVPALIQWAFVDSVWFTDGEACKQADGACWSAIW